MKYYISFGRFGNDIGSKEFFNYSNLSIFNV